MPMTKSGYEEIVCVAIDKDKGSQHALKWAIDHLVGKNKCITLLHVNNKPSSVSAPLGSFIVLNDGTSPVAKTYRSDIEGIAKHLFLTFRCFCTRKDIQVTEILLEDVDIVRALCDYARTNLVDNLVVSASSKGGFTRKFRGSDVASSVTKLAPDFCNVYTINKGKVSSVRNASIPVPSHRPQQMRSLQMATDIPDKSPAMDIPDKSTANQYQPEDKDSIRSPFTRGRLSSSWSYGNLLQDSDISFISSSRPSTDRFFPENPEINFAPRLSNGSQTEMRLSFGSQFSGSKTNDSNSTRQSPDRSLPDSPDVSFVARLSNDSETDIRLSFGSQFSGRKTNDSSSSSFFSQFSGPKTNHSSNSSFGSQFSGPKTHDSTNSSFVCTNDSGSGSLSWTSDSQDDVEAELTRLKDELKKTMDMYSAACKEAQLAKQKASELQRRKTNEQQKHEEVKLSEEAALAIAEQEKIKCRAAIEAAEAAQRIAELESQKAKDTEMRTSKEMEERKRVLSAIAQGETRYRKYTIDDIQTATANFSDSLKIGEGGYGPVFKCYLDHTPVAVKVLRPDATQGRSQFQKEVEVLSCMRHPNMVLLLGACPEYGCLVYEHMENGSLDDCLFQHGNTPALPWQLRFRIAAEIGTGLLFLHQAKPEPLVHRDLKPANILLDRNYVGKIGDVGLARLVPPSVADSVTQYLMTSTAGTFCYIDPEYQQTGMLGTKSDIYSLGVLLLQLITAKSPMGLTHHVERAIQKGRLADVLDPAVPDWPVDEALSFAKLALQCTEMKRKDRPDLATVVLPELERLRTLAEETMPNIRSLMASSSARKSDFKVTRLQPSGYDSDSNSPGAPNFSDRETV